MRVLVTGASGFIGLRVIEALVKIGRFEIIATSRGHHADWPDHIRYEAADLLRPGAGADLVARVRPSHLIHLAWEATPGHFWTSADNLAWAAATLELVTGFAKAGGVRAVLAGTCAEYAWNGTTPISESSEVAPQTFYGIMKDATRRSACAANTLPGLSIAWARIFWLYGPGERAGRLIPDTLAAIRAGRAIEVGHGRIARDFLHVGDVADAIIAALESEWVGPFNVGSGQAIQIRSILERLGHLTGRGELILYGRRETPPDTPKSVVANIDVLSNQICFRPRFSLDEGLWQLVEQMYR